MNSPELAVQEQARIESLAEAIVDLLADAHESRWIVAGALHVVWAQLLGTVYERDEIDQEAEKLGERLAAMAKCLQDHSHPIHLEGEGNG